MGEWGGGGEDEGQLSPLSPTFSHHPPHWVGHHTLRVHPSLSLHSLPEPIAFHARVNKQVKARLKISAIKALLPDSAFTPVVLFMAERTWRSPVSIGVCRFFLYESAMLVSLCFAYTHAFVWF